MADADSITKICTKCGVEKPALREFFAPQKSGRYGLHSQCKPCRNVYSRAYYANHDEDLIKRALIRTKKWREQNRERRNAAERRRWAERSESDPSFRERYARYARDRRRANPELAREIRKRDAATRCHHVVMRRAKELHATPAWADRKAIAEIYKRCAEITKSTGIAHHVDHIIPLRGKNVCGLHVETNLQILPAKENFAKSNKLIDGQIGPTGP